MGNSKKKNLPAMPLYIGDWKKDPAVLAMTAEDEGIYFRLIMLCWESEKRGYLQINNKPIPIDLLARMINLDNQRLTTWLTLYQNNFCIFGLTKNNIMYSKKHVEIIELSEKRKNAGKQGGNPLLLNQGLTTSQPNGKLASKPVTEDKDESISKTIIGNIDVKEIIDDLNEVLSTNYRDTTKKTISLIEVRLKEGFTIDDFKIVHRNMYKCWINDDKMSKFLRPKTLYGNNFESYLNLKETNTKISDVTKFNLEAGKEFLRRGEQDEKK